MTPKPRRVKIPLSHDWESRPLPVVSDAAIATGAVGEGRLIPLVIVDVKDRPDVAELIRVQEHVPIGDVFIQWGQRPGASGTVALMLAFLRPAQVFVILEFPISKYGGFVDNILTSRGLYIQSGVEGDRLATTIDHRRILIEVPDTGFMNDWEQILRDHLSKGSSQARIGEEGCSAGRQGFPEDLAAIQRVSNPHTLA